MNDVELHVLRCKVAELDARIVELESKLAFLEARGELGAGDKARAVIAAADRDDRHPKGGKSS